MDRFMRAAIEEAKQGLREGGIPIGAVLVKGDEIISRGRNRRVQTGDLLRHAEIDCLGRAGEIERIRGSVLYTTFMPCYMCAGAVLQFGIAAVVVGESQTPLPAARALLEAQGVEVLDLDIEECKQLLGGYIDSHPERFAHLAK